MRIYPIINICILISVGAHAMHDTSQKRNHPCKTTDKQHAHALVSEHTLSQFDVLSQAKNASSDDVIAAFLQLSYKSRAQRSIGSTTLKRLRHIITVAYERGLLQTLQDHHYHGENFIHAVMRRLPAKAISKEAYELILDCITKADSSMLREFNADHRTLECILLLRTSCDESLEKVHLRIRCLDALLQSIDYLYQSRQTAGHLKVSRNALSRPQLTHIACNLRSMAQSSPITVNTLLRIKQIIEESMHVHICDNAAIQQAAQAAQMGQQTTHSIASGSYQPTHLSNSAQQHALSTLYRYIRPHESGDHHSASSDMQRHSDTPSKRKAHKATYTQHKRLRKWDSHRFHPSANSEHQYPLATEKHTTPSVGSHNAPSERSTPVHQTTPSDKEKLLPSLHEVLPPEVLPHKRR